ncbi:hypothetical protein BC936DRAFT_137089 [Jimgerdemannia flammicorona]|uniref:DUF1308 domain-containing protein n=1 Tax=Jimgerdemannia flammicorona TaxID=994334 RepID=A0A433CY43_9FUNG|nr:hypothetical protein BC936DRAFT_137089 [Jimgerdemannia flammicorona]
MAPSETDTVPDLELYARTLHDKAISVLADVERWEGTTEIQGLDKYKSVVKAEVKFLEKILEFPDTIKKEHVQSSNVSYLDAVRNTVLTSSDVVSVFKNFSFVQPITQTTNPTKKKWSVKVDVIADGGMRWYKVNARNVRALRHDLAGFEDSDSEPSDSDSDFGSNSVSTLGAPDSDLVDTFSLAGLPVLQQARNFLAAAQQHEVHFRVPAITFRFSGISRNEDAFVDEHIIHRLESMGIRVQMRHEFTAPDPSSPTSATSNLTPSLNLDLTTLIALVSQLSHTRNPQPTLFSDRESLRTQAAQELIRPILPSFHALFHNRTLYTTESARQKLMSVVAIVGGPQERRRAEFLFRASESGPAFTQQDRDLWLLYPPPLPRVEVMPDAPSDRFRDLLLRRTNPRPAGSNRPSHPTSANSQTPPRAIRAKFNAFHFDVFGTGDAKRMTTVTAITWIGRSLSDAGVTGVAIATHEPRSLAEQKMGGWIRSPSMGGGRIELQGGIGPRMGSDVQGLRELLVVV